MLDGQFTVGHLPCTREMDRAFARFKRLFIYRELRDSRGQRPRIGELYRLRDEMKFQNPAILKVQIQEDARRSLKFFRLLRNIEQRRALKPEPSRRSAT